MDIQLICPECEYRTRASSEKELMNKIIIWNHVKAAHPRTAERIMKIYRFLPAELYGLNAGVKILV